MPHAIPPLLRQAAAPAPAGAAPGLRFTAQGDDTCARACVPSDGACAPAQHHSPLQRHVHVARGAVETADKGAICCDVQPAVDAAVARGDAVAHHGCDAVQQVPAPPLIRRGGRVLLSRAGEPGPDRQTDHTGSQDKARVDGGAHAREKRQAALTHGGWGTRLQISGPRGKS
jgi:hypothetical protein